METLNNLKKTTTKKAKRVGRGYGSGVGGHTTTRGAKGDKVRGKTKLTFDGSKIKKSWIKRLPFLRGKHRLLSKNNIVAINLSQLDKLFKANAVVDSKSLIDKLGVKATARTQVKILAVGEIKKSLTIKTGVLFSQQAKNKILEAGGKID